MGDCRGESQDWRHGGIELWRKPALNGLMWAIKRILLFVGLLALLVAPAWADFSDGVAAYERGDYVTAFLEMKPLAEKSS